MKHTESKFLMSRTAKYLYLFQGVLALFIVFLMILSPQNSWVMYFILLSVLFGVLREIKGYRLSDEDTIESYRLLGRATNKSVKIQSILAWQEITPKKLLVEYQKEGRSSPAYTYYLLKPDDILYLKEELLKRNPSIEVI